MAPNGGMATNMYHVHWYNDDLQRTTNQERSQRGMGACPPSP